MFTAVFDRLRVSVFTHRDLKLEPTVLSDNKMTATTNGDLDSMNGAFRLTQPPPSPFSAKPVLRELVDNREVRQDISTLAAVKLI